MSAVVRPAEPRDIEAVAELLHEHMNARIPPDRWRRLLDYPWRPAGTEHGWLVEDRGRVVGFMATIYSDRPTLAGLKRFCDLGAWYLLRDYRGSGIGETLLRAGMDDPRVTYATMTARRATGRRIRALGFDVLDEQRWLFRPGADTNGVSLEIVGEDHPGLTPDWRRIVVDHRGLNLHYVLFGHRAERAYLAYHRKLKGDHIAYHEVLHISDSDLFARLAPALATLLVREERGVLAADRRFLPDGCSPEGELETLPLARWFRSTDVQAAEIDHLYSETLLLDTKLP